MPIQLATGHEEGRHGVYPETDSGSSIIDAINGQASWNANYGFQGSADISFSAERLGNWIQGNGAYSDEQVALNRFEERYGDMKPTDKAFQKAAMGLKLTDEDIRIISAEKEKRDKDAAAKKQQEQAQTKQKLDILRGVGKKNEDDKIIVQLKGNEKSEFLKEAQKFVIEKIKNAIKGEGEQYEVINKALKDFETNPNADTASKLIQAYEDTSSAIGVGFVPVAGDVIDGLIAIKDVHEKNYFAASISTAAFFLPLIPAPLAKKVIGKVKNKVADVVKESEIGKWLAGRFGKKADEVIEQAASKAHKNSNSYIGPQSVYEITVNEKTLKFGKADMEFISPKSGLPVRLQSQINTLKRKYPDLDIDGKVLYFNKEISTKEIKRIETEKIQNYYNFFGELPPKNKKHPGIIYE